MKQITATNEILEELKKVVDKYLECVYVKTNAFDIYLRDANLLELTCDDGVNNIAFNTRVNLQKFPVDIVESLVYDTTEFELFTDFYDEDDDCEFYSLRFKGSEVVIYFCVNLEEQE